MLAMLAAARHHEHLASPIPRHLQRDMRRTAEAIKPDRRIGLDAGPLHRAIADDPGAQQRRGFLIAQPLRQAVGEILAHDRVLGVSAVMILSGEAGVGAEVFVAAPAIDAGAAGLAQPRDSDPLAGLETIRAGTASLNHADHLMPGTIRGWRGGRSPSLTCRSVRQTPQTSTRTRTSP